MESLGERLRMIRNSKKITLQELAERIDCSVGFLSKVERDESGVSTENALKLAQALQVGVGVLLGEEPVPAVLFACYLRSLSSAEQFNIEMKSVAGRVSLVLQWLGQLNSARYNLTLMAKHLGIHVETLNGYQEDRLDLGSVIILDRLVELTGIPVEFFSCGMYPGVTVSSHLTPTLIRYGRVIEEAASAGIPPEFLHMVIEAVRKSGIRNAFGLDELSCAIQRLGRT